MRTLQLTHEQIELILNALNQAETNLQNSIKQNIFILNTDTKNALIDQVNELNNLAFQINNSELDV